TTTSAARPRRPGPPRRRNPSRPARPEPPSVRRRRTRSGYNRPHAVHQLGRALDPPGGRRRLARRAVLLSDDSAAFPQGYRSRAGPPHLPDRGHAAAGDLADDHGGAAADRSVHGVPDPP